MEDLIQIVAVLIFIFSLISSVLSKKKKETVNRQNEMKDYNIGTAKTNTTIPVKDDYDILREIEDMFKTPEEREREREREKAKTENPIPRIRRYNESYRNENEYTIYSNKRSSSETGRSDSETTMGSNRRSESEFSSTESEHSITSFERKAPVIVHESLLLNYDEYKPGRRRDGGNKIISEFSDKKSLRKFFIYSEILGEPKAFS